MLIKDQEKCREEMAWMMDVLIRLSKGKRITNNLGLVNTVVEIQMVTEGPVHSLCPIIGYPPPEMNVPLCPAPLLVNAF